MAMRMRGRPKTLAGPALRLRQQQVRQQQHALYSITRRRTPELFVHG